MSCLFISFQYFLQENNYEIRNKVCDYLQENGKLIEGLETNDILQMETPNYIQCMRNQNTWGGAIEIQTACNIWKMKVIVHNRRNQEQSIIEFLPVNSDFERTIEIEWKGGHYEPIRK